MENIPVTTYRGFSQVSSETTLAQDVADIREGKYARLILKIAGLVEQGGVEEANRVKRQLPFHTLTANYRERRLPPYIVRYNPAITLDIDELPADRIEAVRALINNDPNTLASFLSPKRHGFKFFVHLHTEFVRRLYAQLGAGSMPYADLEALHLQLYDASRAYYETLLGVPIDGSGKDISRGYFLSFDPQAYLNTGLLADMQQLDVCILPPSAEAKRTTAASRDLNSPDTCRTLTPDACQAWEQMEFAKAFAATRRMMKFEPGTRDSFLFTLGNRCFAKGLDEETTLRLARRKFEKEDFDVDTPIRNAYTYTDKTDAAATRKEDKTPLVRQIMDYLDQHYCIRRNIVLDRLEFRPLAAPGAASVPAASSVPVTASADAPAYLPLRNRDVNSIFLDLQLAGITCFQNYLKAIIDSSYAADFNPFEGYLYHLPPWDGTTDHIGRLAATLTTDEPDFWCEGFRRWLVGFVACALRADDVNQLVPILFSEQGKGKSSWIRRLLPPQWKEYYHNGMIDPANKDDLLLLSTRLLINMEEFEGVRMTELASLKRIITQEKVTQRKVYDTQAFAFTRCASFIASTNNRQCLQDIGGNRRFLPITVREVDYRTPVDYTGVYSQALALLRSGFKFWYEGSEIDALNRHNEYHRLKDPVEENLFVYFRRALPEDYSVKWMPAAAILTKIAVYGKIQVNRQSMQNLVQTLGKYNFPERRNEQDTLEYQVVDLQGEEVESRFKMAG